MRTVPKKYLDRIQFYQDHIPPWTANAAAIGTSTVEVSALDVKAQAARTAYDAQQAAQQAARTATEAFKNTVAAMFDAGAGIIKQIRARGQTTAELNVYVLAQIPAPATPSPVAPPGTPDNFKIALSVDGSLELKWKCANPAGCDGVVYQIWRRTTPTGAFTYLGVTGERKFIDSNLPARSGAITYQLQAVRSTSAGPRAQFNVNFGGIGSGPTTASVVETPGKRAA